MPSDTREQAIERLNSLITGIRVVMLSTVSDDGTVHSRPMATQRRESRDGVLWFFTRAGSHTVSEVAQDHRVNVAFVSPEDNRYLSISGVGRVVRDRDKAAELWSPVLKAWFPEGLDTPDLALLRVEITLAAYWDSPSSRMVLLKGFGEGTQPQIPYGEHAPH